MAEKLYEIPIDHPLTAAKRKAIDKYIASNAHLSPSSVSTAWDEEALRIETPPVKWEIRFNAENVEIFGDAPFWARLLFTKEKKALLKTQIELLLRDTGFVGVPAKSATVAKPKKPPKKIG